MGIGGHRMSEVEKLYKIAGVKKQYYYFDSADGNTYTWELNENGNDKHNMCFIGKPKIKDREFTAEKQLEVVKMILFSTWWMNLKRLQFSEKFEVGLAQMINELWQDITEQDRTEIAEILRG